MMVGAKIVNIKNRSFGKAFVASMLIAFLGSTCVGLLGLIHPLLGAIGILLVPGIFIKMIYSCGLGEAIIAYIINICASIAIMIGIILTIILGFGITIENLQKDQKPQTKTEETKPVDTQESQPKTSP